MRRAKAEFFGDGPGTLMVRATQAELDKIGLVIAALNNPAATNGGNAPSVTRTNNDGDYSRSFRETLKSIPPIDLPGDAGSNLIQSRLGLTSATLGQAGSLSHLAGTNGGIIANPDFQAAIHALQQRSGTEVLGEPEVTTSSGQWDRGETGQAFRPLGCPLTRPPI